MWKLTCLIDVLYVWFMYKLCNFALLSHFLTNYMLEFDNRHITNNIESVISRVPNKLHRLYNVISSKILNLASSNFL